MKRLLYILILSLIFTACKSLDKPKDLINIENLVKQDHKSNVFIRARIEPNFPDISQSFTANIFINGLDSLSIQIFGPFSISLGRLYADNDNFVFFNTFENSIYIGNPSSENLKRVSGLELDYKDLVKIIRLSIPSELEAFRLDTSYKSNGKILFSNIADYPEYILFSSIQNEIIQYQRKDESNQNKLSVFYDDFKDFEIGRKPSEVKVDIPDANGSFTLNIIEYRIDEQNEMFSFSYPSNIKVVNLGN